MVIFEQIILLKYPSNFVDQRNLTLNIKRIRELSPILLLKRITDFIFPLRPIYCKSPKEALEKIKLFRDHAMKNPDKYYDVETLVEYLDHIISAIKRDIAIGSSAPL